MPGRTTDNKQEGWEGVAMQSTFEQGRLDTTSVQKTCCGACTTIQFRFNTDEHTCMCVITALWRGLHVYSKPCVHMSLIVCVWFSSVYLLDNWVSCPYLKRKLLVQPVRPQKALCGHKVMVMVVGDHHPSKSIQTYNSPNSQLIIPVSCGSFLHVT